MTALALKLYQVVDELDAIGEQLIQNGGELTPEITAQLDALEGAFNEKVSNTALFIRSLEAAAVAAETESARLNDLAKQRRNAIARLKEYVKRQMEVANILKVETNWVVVRIQKNSRPSITCGVPLDELPEGFVRVTRAFNAEAAYALHKTGAPLPAGIEVVVGSHLRIN